MMMQKLFSFIVNTLYFITIIFVVVMVTTTAFMKKVNMTMAQPAEVVGKVVKDDTPVIATGSATIKEILVEDGDRVQAGDALFSYSFATPPRVQVVKASVDGVVKRTGLQAGDGFQANWKIMDIYQDANPRLLVYLTEDEYNQIKKTAELHAYSKRLDQAFTVTPKVLQADVQDNADAQQKIGIYFEFADSESAVSLLNNESLSLILPQQKAVTLKDMIGSASTAFRF